MRIANVVLHSCVRSHKVGWCLLVGGHQVHLVTEQPMEAHGWLDYNSCNLIHTGSTSGHPIVKDHLWRTMKSIAPIVDVVYYSNEPDWPVDVIKDACPNAQLWYDIHDMFSMRSGIIDETEKSAQDLADAIIVPSRRYQEVLFERGYVGKPVIEMLSCVPSFLFPQIRRTPKRRGIVYEGGLKGKKLTQSIQFEFRSWAEVFRKWAEMDVEVWAYPADTSENFDEYRKSGVIMMNPLPYPELLMNLTAHEAGLVGSPYPDPAFDGALPNKMFEYIAAGIPVICLNAPTAADFVLATGTGYVAEKVEDIPMILEKIREEKPYDHIWDIRKNWAMERQVEKLEGIYHKMVEATHEQQFMMGL
jgi:glycosyltransferase involved in cell wall biosynthesis